MKQMLLLVAVVISGCGSGGSSSDPSDKTVVNPVVYANYGAAFWNMSTAFKNYTGTFQNMSSSKE